MTLRLLIKYVNSFTYISAYKFSIGSGRLPWGTREKYLSASKSMIFVQANLHVMNNIYQVLLEFIYLLHSARLDQSAAFKCAKLQ